MSRANALNPLTITLLALTLLPALAFAGKSGGVNTDVQGQSQGQAQAQQANQAEINVAPPSVGDLPSGNCIGGGRGISFILIGGNWTVESAECEKRAGVAVLQSLGLDKEAIAVACSLRVVQDLKIPCGDKPAPNSERRDDQPAGGAL